MRGVPLTLWTGAAGLWIGAAMAGAPPYMLLVSGAAALTVGAITVLAAGANKHRIDRTQAGIDRTQAEIGKTQAELSKTQAELAKILFGVDKLRAHSKVSGILDEMRKDEKRRAKQQPLNLDDVRAIPVDLDGIEALAGVTNSTPLASVTVLAAAVKNTRGNDWAAS